MELEQIITEKHSRRLFLECLGKSALGIYPYSNGIQNILSYPSIYAGVAREDITPIKWNMQAPMWLGGFSPRGNTPVNNQNPMAPGNELYATALAIQDVQGTNVIITADILGFPRYLAQEIRMALRSEFGLEDRQILLNASHTHSGPALPQQLDPYIAYGLYPAEIAWLYQYSGWLKERIIDAARKALSNLEPAEMYFGQAALNYSHQRVHGFSRWDFNDMNVLAFKHAGAAKNKAIVVSYAAHPILMGSSYMQFHPDYFGVVQRHIEQFYPGSICLPIQGATGDLNPAMPGNLKFVGSGVGPCQMYGEALAYEAARIINRSLIPLTGRITTKYAEVQLPLDLPDINQLLLDYEIIKQNSNPNTPTWRHAKTMLEKIASGQLPSTVPYPIQVLLFEGNPPLAWIALAGEPVHGFARLSEDKLKKMRVWVSGYSNEYPLYLASDEMLPFPRYETGWRQHPFCRPISIPRNTPTYAAGSTKYFGLSAPLRGRQYEKYGLPSAEQIVEGKVLEMVR